MDYVLELKNVKKSIKGKPIIKGLSFSVKKGQIYGFLGPNGAGKTMTLRMIVGLIRPSEGEVFISGHSVKSDFVNAMANIGCIIENPEFYEYLSGFENLKLLADMEKGITPGRIGEVVELVGLTHRINDKVKTYSLGMKQRLGIAQALMKSPKLLLLDEPTNGLDPAGIKEFRSLMQMLSKVHGMTVFVSSHLLSELQMICDEVAIILHGALIKTAPMDALLSEQKVIWKVESPLLAKQILKETFDVDGQIDGDSLWAMLSDEKVLAVNEAFVSHKVGLSYVCKQQKSLEDLFMDLTGGETIG